MRDMAMRRPKPPKADLRITEQDERDAARISAMWVEKQARDRVTCIDIGHQIEVHLERKNLRHGMTDRYARVVFGKAWETLRPCLRLCQRAPYLKDAEDVAERYPEWVNGYVHEPQRSINLLNWAAEVRKKERLESENSRAGPRENNAINTDRLTLLVGDCRVRLCGLPDSKYKALIA
jgi:hypothetical protein